MELQLAARAMSTFVAVSLLAMSVYYFFKTLLLNPFLIFTPSQLRDIHFKRFFEWAGPQINENKEHIRAIREQLLPHMRGTVMDIGPGTGDPLASCFASFVANVDVVYGIEPNAKLHPQLLAAASRAGFNTSLTPTASSSTSASSGSKAARYIPLQASIEPSRLFPALASAHLVGASSRGDGDDSDDSVESYQMPAGGVFDSIVAIRALCSSPLAQEHPAALIALLHKLLKPGGQLLLFEHVANDADPVAAATQLLLNTVWPTLVGGCALRSLLAREMRRQSRIISSRNSSSTSAGVAAAATADAAGQTNDANGKVVEWKSVEVRPAAASPAAKVSVVPFVTIRAVKA